MDFIYKNKWRKCIVARQKETLTVALLISDTFVVFVLYVVCDKDVTDLLNMYLPSHCAISFWAPGQLYVHVNSRCFCFVC